MNNTVTASNGAEIYLSRLYELADEYVECEYVGEGKNIPQSAAAMMFYISDRIEKPSHDDIEQLDKVFQAYVKICCKYGILPTLELFGILIQTSPSTFSDWQNGEYRVTSAHGKTVKKWKETCRGLVVNRLHNSPGGNVNLIFCAKACYGMVETAPVPIENKEQVALQATNLPKLGMLEESEDEK